MTARQRVKVLQVIDLIRGWLEDARNVNQEVLQPHISKITRWSDEALHEYAIDERKISAGAKREFELGYKELWKARLETIGPNVSPQSLVQELIACDGLLDWICRNYDLRGNTWRYLRQTVDTATRKMVSLFPEHEDATFYIKADEVLAI